jgi:hypothetical protein
MPIKYKGVDIANIYHPGNTKISNISVESAPTPFEKNFPIGIKIKNVDISDLAKSRYQDFNTAGSVSLPVGYKHISAFGWGGGGGGGGHGGGGRKCCCGGTNRGNSGAGGGNGGTGGYFAISKYPIQPGQKIDISVGNGGVGAGNGGSANNCNGGKGKDADAGAKGGDSNIHVGGTHICWAEGGHGGGGGNAGTSGGNGNRGGNGGNGGRNYGGGATHADGAPGQWSGVGGGQNAAGTNGFVRVYLHYQ